MPANSRIVHVSARQIYSDREHPGVETTVVTESGCKSVGFATAGISTGGFEAEASSISSYESLLVPGLLQTEEYVRATIQSGRTTADPEEVDRIVAARSARKALLSRDVPPKLWIVLDEGAVRRVVGGPDVMRSQVARLIEACENPAIVMQVLPFSAGAHAAMGGPFTILDYDDKVLDPTVVYLGNDTSTLLLEKEAQVARYRLMFDHLRAKALDPDRSGEFLTRVMADYPK